MRISSKDFLSQIWKDKNSPFANTTCVHSSVSTVPELWAFVREARGEQGQDFWQTDNKLCSYVLPKKFIIMCYLVVCLVFKGPPGCKRPKKVLLKLDEAQACKRLKKVLLKLDKMQRQEELEWTPFPLCQVLCDTTCVSLWRTIKRCSKHHRV